MTIYQKVYKAVYGDVNTEHVFDALRKKYQLDEYTVIYDIGCGYGRLFKKLTEISRHSYAVDVDDEAIEVFKSLYPSFKIAKEIDLDWPPPDFALFYFHVLNYMNLDDIHNCFKKLSQSKKVTPIILYANVLNFDKFSGPSFWRNHPVLLEDKKYLLRNSIKRADGEGTNLFIEEIWCAETLLIKKESKLYNWSNERLIDIAGNYNFRVKKVSNVDLSLKSRELILELS